MVATLRILKESVVPEECQRPGRCGQLVRIAAQETHPTLKSFRLAHVPCRVNRSGTNINTHNVEPSFGQSHRIETQSAAQF